MEEEKNESPLIKNLGIVPKLSIIVILLSLLFHILYYRHFGLPIKYFMNFSELGIAISDDLLYFFLTYSIFIVSILFNDYLYLSVKKMVGGKYPEKKKTLLNNPIFQRIFIILLIIVIIVIIMIRPKNNYDFILLILSLLLGFSIFNLMTTKNNYGKTSILKNRNFALIASFILSLALSLSHRIESVETGGYKGTIITTVDSTYISNDSIYFIGKTEKYVFIYKAKEKGTLVIPTESLKQIFIKAK